MCVKALGWGGGGCFGTAFAASAHGGDVRESCGSGHAGCVGKMRCFAIVMLPYFVKNGIQY